MNHIHLNLFHKSVLLKDINLFCKLFFCKWINIYLLWFNLEIANVIFHFLRRYKTHVIADNDTIAS